MGKALSKATPNKAETAATQAKPAEAPAPTQQVEASVIPPVQEAVVAEKPAAVVEEPVVEPVVEPVESVPETKAEPEPEVPAAPVPVEDVAPEVPAAPLPEEDVPPEVPTAPLPVEDVVPEPVVVEAPTLAEPEPLISVCEPEPIIAVCEIPAPESVPEPVTEPEPEVIPVAPEPVVEAEPEPAAALDEPVDLLAQESVPLSAPLVDLGVPDLATMALDTPLSPDLSAEPASPLEPTDVLGDEGCQEDSIEAAVNSAASPEEPEESTEEPPAIVSVALENVEQPLCDVNQEVSDGPLKHLDLMTGNGFMNDLIPNDVQIPDDIPVADISLSNELM